MKKRLVPAAFAACCLPALWLAIEFFRGGLGADPIAAALNDLGYIAFVLLVATLACTPLQIALRLSPATSGALAKAPLLLRKLLGDFCFFYATLHLSTYAVLDQGLNFGDIGKDLLKHRFIFLGMATWVLLLPLAITSTQGWQKRLGFRKWKRLHRVVYLCGGLAGFHFLLRFKTPRVETVAWLLVVALLLFVRVVERVRRRTERMVHSA
jgi:sulfoxide reductase heme-binding subunit YedZ